MRKNDPEGAFTPLLELVEKLRGPGGCPWDAKQTDESIKMYLLEEAFEVLDALETGPPEAVCEELGDLLFQIIFLARLAEERKEFDLGDVIGQITKKMIHRHPHVFQGQTVNGPEEVAENWHRIKTEEKGGDESLQTKLGRIPAQLPALMRSHRLQERAARENGGSRSPEEAWKAVHEAFEHLGEGISQEESQRTGEALAKMLFALADLARILGHNGENLLREENHRFVARFKS